MSLDSVLNGDERPAAPEAAVALSDDDVLGLLGTLADGIIVMDEAGVVRFFSDAAARMFGYAPAEIIGRKLSPLMFEEDIPRHEAGLARRRHGPASGGLVQVRGRRKDGSELPLEIAIGQATVHGQTIFLGSLRDISERKRTEKALRTSEEKFGKVFWSSPDSMVLTRQSDGMILDFNDRFLEMNGYTAEQIQGKTAVELGIWSDPGKREAFLKAAKKQDRTEREATYQRPDGRIGTVIAMSKHVEIDGVDCILSTARDITDRKLAEDALRQSEQSLRDAQRIARVGNWEFNVSERRFKFSAEIARIFEAAPDQTESTWDEFMRIVHRDDRGKFDGLIADNPRQGSSFDFEYEIYLRGGWRKIIQTQGEVQAEPDGTFRVLGTNQDITEQKLAEDALRQSEEKFAKVFKVSPDLVLITRAGTGAVVDANEKILPITGYRKEEVLGKPMGNWVHPEDQIEIRRLLDETGECSEYETRFRHRDGRVFVGLVYARTIRIENEDCILSVTRDITERKRADEELRQSRELLEAVVDGAPVGISTKDEAHRYTFMNRYLADVYGVTREEAVGKTASDLVGPGYGGAIAEHDREVFATGQPLANFVDESVDASGAVRSWLTTKLPLRGNDQQGPQILSISLDITERKLAEEGLRHASKLEAVGQLTGGIAHDFNNLLTALIGNLHFLGDRIGGDPEVRRYLNVSLGAAVRGADLTQRLLAFSRKQVLKPQSADINVLVDGMTELLARTLGSPIKITPKLTSGLPPVIVDASQLESAIVNLAINSRDAMFDGGELTIETARAMLDEGFAAPADDFVPGPYVSLAVSDTGCGMQPDVLERAFEPFFTTKEVGRGSGLGLSTIFGFIKQTGGQTAVTSQPGVGTTVTLYLPLADAPPAAGSAAHVEKDAPPTGTELILVVEDDLDVQAFVVAVLRHLGYRVEVASDGVQAVEMLPDIPTPDLLLTDLVLPGGMDGLKTAQEVARRCPSTKILFASGHTNRDFLGSGELGQNLEFMPKPYTRESLAERVRKILDA